MAFLQSFLSNEESIPPFRIILCTLLYMLFSFSAGGRILLTFWRACQIFYHQLLEAVRVTRDKKTQQTKQAHKEKPEKKKK